MASTASKIKPIGAYSNYQEYVDEYPQRLLDQRAFFEAQPGLGIPEETQKTMLGQVSKGVVNEASKYGVLRSGETATGLENAATNIALQDYMTKESNVNKALGLQFGLESTDLQRAYDEAVAAKDFARAKKLASMGAEASQNASNTAGWANIASGGLQLAAAYFLL